MQNQANQTTAVYREVQQLRQVWLWVVVLIAAGIMWYAAVKQLLLHTPVGSQPMPDDRLIVFWLLFGIGLPVLLLCAKLVTEVRADGIYLRFFPLQLKPKKIAFEELKSCKVKTYKPILDHGGGGIRRGSKGKTKTASGRNGVELHFRDGEQFLIGSLQPEELCQAIRAELGKRLRTTDA